MKRKKKKKVNGHQSRQMQRASFNHFCKQIHYYLKLIECEDLAELFDKESCSLLYKIRNTNLPKLRIAKGVYIRTTVKKRLYADFDFLISAPLVENKTNDTISAKDIIQYLALIDANVRFKGEGSFDFNTMRLIHKYKEKMPDFDALHKLAMEEIAFISLYLGMTMSRMNSSICWLKLLRKPEGDEDRKMVFELNEYIPRKQTMIIDGNRRPVYPVCLAFNDAGPQQISIAARRIRLPKRSIKPVNKAEIPVYFQNHLMHRLEERLDCMPLHMRQYWLFSSMEKMKFIHFNGKLLVEYIAEGNIKLGYIVVEFHEGRLLAKTFLLLTNSGTPEGEKLKKLSGMQKYDLQYWAIDKLSTFQTSDLKDHPKTKALFEQAGCGNLFKELSTQDSVRGMSSSTQAKQILQYIEGAKEQEEMLVAV